MSKLSKKIYKQLDINNKDKINRIYDNFESYIIESSNKLGIIQYFFNKITN